MPGVDVIHLHHAVWVNTSRSATTGGFPVELFFAAGEEKTILNLPAGYGYPLKRTDGLVLNHMIHNLTPVPTQVYMVWQIDFIPASSPAARGIRPVRPIWMDVRNGDQYPVFNVRKGSGEKGSTRTRTGARNPYSGGSARNKWVVDRPGVLVGTAGHLHPGGLHTDMYAAPPRREDPAVPQGATRRAGAATRLTCSAPSRSTSSRLGPCRGTLP